MALTGSSVPGSSQAPRGLPQLPSLLCLVSFSWLLSEAVNSALSCFTGVIATHIHRYLILLMGVTEFSILLCHHHLGL